MASRLRTFLLNAGLVAVSLAVGLVALEAGMWLVHPPPSPYSLPRDLMTAASGVWTLTPDFRGVMDNRVDFRAKQVSVDARGIRRTPPATNELPQRRLFVLGDSQTFGHGLSDDETWPARLQGLLQADRPGTQVENWGVPGINIDQYAARLARVLAEAAKDDTIVVGVSWNDLITPQEPQGVMRVVEGYLVNTPLRPADAAGPLAADSTTAARIRLYDYTGIVLPPLQDAKQFAEALAANSALASFFMPRLRALWHRWRPATPLTQVVEGHVPEANFWLLYDMKERANAQGVGFAVVLLPERYFIDDAMYHAYSGGGRFFPERNYMGYIAQPLCRSFDISCIDPFEALVEHHRREPVTFHVDGHYNPAGAAVVAAVLARELKSFLP
jgi:lysophospholipase L1-like esterase